MFKIKASLKSQFAQIDKGETGSDGVTKVLLKKVKCFVEDSKKTRKVISVPVITGNGFRGMLRRETLSLVMESLVTKGIDTNGKNLISVANFNLMNAGGANDFQRQKIEVENRVRELNPLISIFGTSLAVSGKISTPNLNAYEKEGEEYHIPFYETEKGYIFSSVIADESFIKMDDIIQGKDNVKFLTTQQISEWRDSTKENSTARAEERNSGTKKDPKDKTKKTALQAILSREYVIPGTNFYGYIEDIHEDMTSIEKGLLVLALERAITKKFGSTRSRGYGSFEYSIEFDDKKSRLANKIDVRTGRNINIFKEYSEEIEKNIADAKKWLADIDIENIQIAEIMEGKN